VVLSLDGFRVITSTPRVVFFIAHGNHFGGEVQEQALRQHKTPEIWDIDQGISLGYGFYPMDMNYNLLFVPRSCYAESKWCLRRLTLNEQLQLYDISNIVRKCLYDYACVALVNV
jgi:hypothetical protein